MTREPLDPHDLPSDRVHLPGYLLRIREDREHIGTVGDVLVCDFDLVKCDRTDDGNGYRYTRDERFFQGLGPHDGSTADLSQAEVQLEGFVKLDGCTQFWTNRVHIDERLDLDDFLDAISEARRLCAERLGRDVADEYHP